MKNDLDKASAYPIPEDIDYNLNTYQWVYHVYLENDEEVIKISQELSSLFTKAAINSFCTENNCNLYKKLNELHEIKHDKASKIIKNFSPYEKLYKMWKTINKLSDNIKFLSSIIE